MGAGWRADKGGGGVDVLALDGISGYVLEGAGGSSFNTFMRFMRLLVLRSEARGGAGEDGGGGAGGASGAEAWLLPYCCSWSGIGMARWTVDMGLSIGGMTCAGMA